MKSSHSRVQWCEPQEDPELDLDRDTRITRYASAKGAGRERMEPVTSGGHRGAAWGGALRRVTVASTGPTREDEVAVPGRRVPIGYARYVSPGVDPHAYFYPFVSGWRVAVPRAATPFAQELTLRAIFRHGPQAAGYVRVGDTLVPASLGPGDRATIAETATWSEPDALGP